MLTKNVFFLWFKPGVINPWPANHMQPTLSLLEDHKHVLNMAFIFLFIFFIKLKKNSYQT